MAEANINSFNEIVIKQKDTLYAKIELFSALKNMLSTSGFRFIDISQKQNGVLTVSCLYKEAKYYFICFLKNITNSGWKDKPLIKRIQITNLRLLNPTLYVDTTETSTILVLGYYNFDSNPLFVAWDFYKYTMHNTQRSCYVDLRFMQEAYRSGFRKTRDKNNNSIWAFLPNYFKQFIFEYISERKIA